MTADPAIETFLCKAGWGGAKIEPLAGDASIRRYHRLHNGDQTAVLMDDRDENTTAHFACLAAHLVSHAFSAPAVLASDPGSGLLLLEDLGDDLFVRVIERDASATPELYAAAVDMLSELHGFPAPAGLPAPDPETLAEWTAPLFDWYLRGADRDIGPMAVARARAAITGELARLLHEHTRIKRPVLALRDFHAENLLWLPKRQGRGRVGLLDFQDAFSGHPAYDLISLLTDARRDIDPALRDEMTERYMAATHQTPACFLAGCAVLTVQRNLRILGIFARLSLQGGKPRYINMIPRVWANIQHGLAHPELSALRDLAAVWLPTPTPELIQGLKDRCGTIPAQ